jgi:hypothetical protein
LQFTVWSCLAFTEKHILSGIVSVCYIARERGFYEDLLKQDVEGLYVVSGYDKPGSVKLERNRCIHTSFFPP